MTGTIIFTTLYIILIIKLFTNKNEAIEAYIIFSLISPNLRIGQYQISFEIAAFLPVLFVLFLKRTKVFAIFNKSVDRQYLWLYFFIYIVATLVSTLKYEGNINLIPIFGYFRAICIIYMLQYIMKDNPSIILDNILTPVLFINFVFSVIQLSAPSSVNIFYEFYYKDSMTPLKETLKLGYFNRAYGTFGTPVSLGILAVFAFAIYIGFISEKKQIRHLYLKLVMSIIIGLMSLSKTAILGIPLTLIVYFLLALFGIIKVKNKKALFIPILIIPIGLIVIYFLIKQGTFILWYIDYLFKPFEAFITRYDSSTGILANTYLIIRDNLLIGVGSKSFENVFSGDSMYIGLMYSTGILGTSLYIVIILISTIRNIKLKHVTAVLCAIAIILAGFAAPIQLNILSVSLLAYIFSKSEMDLNIQKN